MSDLFDIFGNPIVIHGPNRLWEELKGFVLNQHNLRESAMSTMRNGYSMGYDDGYPKVQLHFGVQDVHQVVADDKQVMAPGQVVPFLTRYKDELAAVAKQAVQAAVKNLINTKEVSVVFQVEPEPKKETIRKDKFTVEEAIS